jgi:hypothetical protein
MFMKRHYPLLFLLVAFSLGTFWASAQVHLNLINSPYQQRFDSLAGTGTTNDIATLPAGWTFSESGTNANTTYAAGTGSSNAGNTYSFGLAADDRALGGVLSGSLNPTVGAGFTNNTGSTITALQITYRGEQWRLGATGRAADRLDFQYSTDATSLTSGIWTDIDSLDFSSPVTTGTAGALNGNDTLNNNVVTFTIDGLSINDGETFYLRWLDFNVASSDDGLAIDDFILTPIGVPSNQPSIQLIPIALNFGDVTVNDTKQLRYQVIGANLQDSIAVFTFNNSYTISADSIHFAASATLPSSGGFVYVQFAPAVPGVTIDSLLHISGTTSNVLNVRGNGFDFVSSVISIAEARTKPVGQKVTVGGRITIGNELGNPAYIQDATGGIPVFDYALANRVAIGDSVIVTGPIGIFNDQVQISGNGIAFIQPDSSRRYISPVPVSIAQLAAYEGQLVTVQNVTLVNKAFVFYPQSTERITAEGIQADLRIDGDTDIPGLAKPQGIVSITGVVGRFRTNAQLLPRFSNDIPGAVIPSPPSDSIPKSKTLDIVTWNLEFFGAKKEDYRNEEYGPEDEAQQLINVKRVLDSLQADVVAVEEVSDDSLFTELISQLGKYRATCSDRYSYSFDGPSDEFPPQKVCFIYDTTTVNVLSARPLFEALYDEARTTNPNVLPNYPGGTPSSFYSSGRLPYLFTVNATIDGVTERISFIGIHAKSGATASDRSRREYDATVLKDSLDAHFASERVIILGDLNDDLDQSIVTGLESPYIAFVNDSLNYTSITKNLSDAGARSTISFQDMIDHQLITNDLLQEYIGGSEQVITPFRFITNYAATTSDHLPVIARYSLQPVQVYFSPDVTLPEDSASHRVYLTADKSSSSAKQITIALSGDAMYGQDFITEPAAVDNKISVTLPADTLLTSFRIIILNDAADELLETATFTVLKEGGVAGGSQPTFTLAIEDNDVPVIAFAEILASAKEGSGIYNLKLKLNTAVASDQFVTIQVTEGPGIVYGEDYSTEPAVADRKVQLLVPAGSREASIAIDPIADGKKEFPLEFVSFYLVQTTEGLVLSNPRISVFTIIDVKKRQPVVIASPNPTTGVVRLVCKELEAHEVVHAEVRNSNGELIYTGNGTLDDLNAAITTRVQSGRRGFYTVKLTIDGEPIVVRILKI